MKKVSKNQKSNLAKLLATENLNVEHRKVSTAFFDVGARTLVLPIWQEMSNDLYDMLVGHEVGHALYTPNDTSYMKKGIPHSMMNVLEDVRIDRKMKLKVLFFNDLKINFVVFLQQNYDVLLLFLKFCNKSCYRVNKR